MRELAEGHERDHFFVCSCGTPEEQAAKRAEVNPTGVTIDQLCYALNHVAYGVEIVADQWFAVIVAGKYGPLDEDGYPEAGEIEFQTYVQCDELDLGLMKTWELWAERYASVNKGRRPWASWEDNGE